MEFAPDPRNRETAFAEDYEYNVYLYNNHLEKAIAENKIALKEINAAIRRRRHRLFGLRNSKYSTKELQSLQRTVSVSIIRARKQHQLIQRTVKMLLAKGSKTRGFDNPTLRQAMRRYDWPQWEEAIATEYAQMQMEGVFEECDIGDVPDGATIVGSMMVLTIKRDPTRPGEIDKYKARLVALGNQQDPSTYDAIKSGTARSASVKLLLALQAKLGSFSVVMDVKGAYLKSKVKEESKQVYLRLPNKKIVKLKKYLYGLKQAGYEWQQNITECLLRLGYVRSVADPLIFSRWNGENYIIMCIHVDDFYVISSKPIYLKELHNSLINEYGEVTVKDGDLLAYLGCKIDIDNETGALDLTQPGYISKMVEKFLSASERENGRRVRTPVKYTYTYKKGDELPTGQREYLEMIGALNYLAQFTRPDILYAVSILAQKCSDPTVIDVHRAKRVFLYLHQTRHVGITFHPGPIELICYADAAFNVYPNSRSHMGYCFSLNRKDGAFYAKSAKTKLTALSSTEAEYIALCEASRDTIWFRRLLNDIGFTQKEPTLIWQDNKSTIEMVAGHMRFQASKHINPKFHFTGELVERKAIRLEHISTKLMVADILTKALSGEDHGRLGNLILG